MAPTYLHVIALIHLGFGGIYWFLSRQRSNRLAQLLAWSWAIEAVRAAILLPAVHGQGIRAELWFSFSDVLCFFANWFLLAAGADVAAKRLPRWLAPVYFGTSIPLVLFNRYLLPAALHALWGVPLASGLFAGIASNLFIMFLPVAVTRLTILGWLFSVWRQSRLPGALIAALFALPYGVVAVALPFQFLYSYSPDWIELVWTLRVIGFSVGLLMLLLSLQQAALVRSEKNLMTAQALAKLGSWELDLSTGLARWSAEMCRLWDRESANAVVSRAEFLETVHPADRGRFERTQFGANGGDNESAIECRLLFANGTIRWLQARSAPLRALSGEVVTITGTTLDITERKQAEARMELQQTVTRALAESGPVQPTMRKVLEIIGRGLDWDVGAIWMRDRTSKSLRCSDVWQLSPSSLAAFSEATRNSAFSPGGGLPGSILSSGQPKLVPDLSLDDTFQRRPVAARVGLRSGAAFPLLVRSEVLGVVEFFSTRSRLDDPEIHALFSALGIQIGQYIERQRLEEQYRQAQRMEAVGTLAGGIAHDFNNILTAITGYSELARLEAKGDPRVGEHLNSVQEAARRAVDLVRQIMAFSRQEELARVSIVLKTVVAEALKLLRATIPATIEINATYDDALYPVLANATSIHQVVVNLGTNAWQAMKDRAGRIEVRLENFEVDDDFAMRTPGLQAGPYICLSVADTGRGMDEATLDRIFEPFFTTKAPGEGTGLGLAVVHGIVQSHDGAVTAYSYPGEGTRFNLYFPAVTNRATAPETLPKIQIARGQGERILFVDDEKSLADMGKKILERLGYVVRTFYDPKEALTVLRADAKEFDLVVTDLTMPGMTGVELASELRQIRPDLPILLTTGYAAMLTPAKCAGLGIREVLLKPHSVESLASAVRRALGSPTSSLETAGAVGSSGGPSAL